MAFSYVIEHMEDDEQTPHSIPKWVELEYKHMRTLAGADATIHFTHLSTNSRATLSTLFAEEGEVLAQASASAHSTPVLQLMKEKGVPLERVCLLDPKAEQELAPEDGDGRFDWFLFGGILGDDPPRDRTSELRVLGFPNRHLGPVQMTTDTALGVTKMVVQDKVQLTEISYLDFPTIVFNARDSVEMPFRYIATSDKQPVLPPGMREHLQEDLDKTFDL